MPEPFPAESRRAPPPGFRPQKILLTGASGLVGAAFAAAAAARGHQVVGVVGRFAGELPGLVQRLTADLTDPAAVTALVRTHAPEAIVNCAAISEPAVCDADPARAEAMNVALPATLAELARELDARFVHISSEQVFDGARTTAYRRDDPPSPINLYGRQKVASERAVLAAAPAQAVVVRAPLLMGDSPGGKRGLHERLLADWAAGRVAKLFVDELRQPCTGANLAAALLELTERGEFCGAFHWGGAELLSRHEIGRRVRAHFGLSEAVAPIAAVRRADVPDAAKQRQACLALDLTPLDRALTTKVETLAEQLTTLRVPAPVAEWLARAK